MPVSRRRTSITRSTRLSTKKRQRLTHPSPIDRFRLVSRVHCDAPEAFAGAMWDLLPNPEALTGEMTSQTESKVKGELALKYPALTTS